MSESFNVMKTVLSRVWLIEGGAAMNHAPSFKNCLKAMAVSLPLGDIEKIECPSPDEFGEFEEVGVIQGAKERETSSLVGRFPLDEESDLLRIAKTRCALDYQINIGVCQDPRNFNDFQKKLIREDAYFTNYGSDDLGALSSDENTVVNETVDTSAKTIYEVLPLRVETRGDDVIDNEGLDVVICDRPSCGNCDNESDGCQIIYVLANSTSGSPGTAPDVVYSQDKGVTWAEDDINSLLASQTANALACVDEYVVVVSNDSVSLHYKTQALILAGTAGGWIEQTTGFVAAGAPNDIWSVGNFGFIVGDGGYIYSVDDPPAGVTVLDAGVATSNNLMAVKAISRRMAVAVGDSATVVYTLNGITWQTTTTSPSAAGLISVEIKTEKEWIVGDDGGEMWYTVDGGETWTQETLPGGNYTAVSDIHFSTKSVGYAAVSRTIGGTARGQILRTYSGGGGNGTEGGWVVLPELIGTIPANDAVNAVYACSDDPNFAVGTGLADNASDGVILVAEK